MQGVNVDFNANLTRFTSAIDKATNELGKFQRNADRMSANVNKIFAGLGVGLSAGMFVSFIKNSIDAADSLNDLSKITGASVETLAGLQLAAKQSGTELETVARGMLKFSGVVLDASNGSKEAADKISALGLNLKTLAAQSPEQQFIALAGALEKFGADKQGVIVADVLGQKMASLTPLLSEGAKGLGEMLEAGKKLNPINTEMAKQADKFNDELEKMKMLSSGLGVNLANEILPGLNRIIEQLTEGTKIAGSFFSAIMLFGTMNPFKSVSASVSSLRKDIAGLEQDQARAISKGESTGRIDSSLETLKKKLEMAKLLQRQEALAGAAGIPIGNEGRGLTKGAGLADYKKPVEAKKSSAAKKTDTGGVDDYESRIKSKVAGLFDDSDIVKAKEYEDTLAYLDKLYFDLGISAEFYDSAKNKLNKTTSNAVDIIKEENARLADLTAGADFTKLKKDQEDMAFLALAFTDGIKQADGSMLKLSEAEYLDTVTNRLGLVKDAGTDTFSELKDAVDGWGKGFTNAMADMVMGGELSFSKLADSIISDLVRMTIQASITKPLFDSFRDGSFLSFFTPTANANGGVYNSPSLSAYSGGVYDSPRAFAFANGAGIFGEAGAEAIMPLQRGANGKLGVAANGMGGGNVIVNVIEAPGKGGQQQQRNEGGMKIVDVFVEQIKASIAGDITRGSGAVPAALGNTYGLNRAAGSY